MQRWEWCRRWQVGPRVLLLVLLRRSEKKKRKKEKKVLHSIASRNRTLGLIVHCISQHAMNSCQSCGWPVVGALLVMPLIAIATLTNLHCYPCFVAQNLWLTLPSSLPSSWDIVRRQWMLFCRDCRERVGNIEVDVLWFKCRAVSYTHLTLPTMAVV